MLHNANVTVDLLLGFIPFLAGGALILTLMWAATKLFPKLGAWMNRPDEVKTEAQLHAEERTRYRIRQYHY